MTYHFVSEQRIDFPKCSHQMSTSNCTHLIFELNLKGMTILSQTKLISTNDGIKLDQSILWFDANESAELSFLSSAHRSGRRPRSQVITTEETAKLLASKKKPINALVCQYNRPFSVGKLRMELLPSGSVLGGASLYLEADQDRILYAPILQTQKNATVRQMQLKKANTLVLGAFVEPGSQNASINRKKEKELFLSFVKEKVASGCFPFIFCRTLGTAQEVTKLLSDEGLEIACHPSIHRLNKVYESFGARLGKYQVFTKHTKNRVVLLPKDGRFRHLVSQSSDRSSIIVVEDGFGIKAGVTPLFANETVFRLCAASDAKDLKEIIQAVSPKQVSVFGPFAKAYVKEISTYFKNVDSLYENDQPTLF